MQTLLVNAFSDRVRTREAWIYRMVEGALIATGLIAMIMGTDEDLALSTRNACVASEQAIATLFAVDWLLRLWAAPLLMTEATHYRARVTWQRSRAGLVGLLSFVPFALVSIFDRSPSGASLLAVLWILRFAHHSKGTDMLLAVFGRELQAILAVLSMFLGVWMTGGVVSYVLEHKAQPDHFSRITDCLWWVIVTLTTTGYGDVVPITAPGRILAGLLMVSGLMVFGLLAGIVATGFASELRRRDFLHNWELVAQVPMFHEVGPGTIADLANLLRPRELPPRSVVARRGQPGDCMYFIVTGEVQVEIEPTPLRLGPGEFFGELALLTGDPRSATIVTTTETRLLSLDIADFRALASDNPDLMKMIQAEAHRRLNLEIEPA